MKVFITGASGYVGQPIVRQLLHAGHEVTAYVRSNTHRKPLSHARLTLCEGQLTDGTRLSQAMDGADVVIHLVGIIREVPKRGITMRDVHDKGTNAVVEAAKQCGVSHFVHMSAQGARSDAPSNYHRTKWAGEQHVLASGLAYTIFRPSVIFGHGGPGPNFVQQLTDLIAKLPVCPVIGDGSALLQPVSIQTVADAFCTSVSLPIARNKVYDLGGASIIRYENILLTIASALQRPFIPVHVPWSAMAFLAQHLGHLQAFPITLDQLLMLKEGNVCENSDTFYRDFQLTPLPFTID